jgi:hypothetical protein
MGVVAGSKARLAAAIALALCVFGTASGASPEKQGAVWLQLKLDALGFPGISSTFLENGASMLTVNFMDDSHILLTYSLRNLVPRSKGAQEITDDRDVAAEVVELPSGKVQARTEWHLHDHSRYLWSLGGGSFLLRIGERLYTFSPLARLATKDVFQRTVFPSRPVSPAAVFVSPDGGLVTVETVIKTAVSAGQTTVLLGDDAAEPAARTGTKTFIDFFRMKHVDGPDGYLEAVAAGSIQSATPLQIPVDEDGLLWASQADSGSWNMTFDAFGGKTIQLGKLESSCMPRMQMLARSEFVALTCRGADDRIKMASFGLDGKETWEESVGDIGAVAFAYAPQAARFAISHTVAAGVPVQAGQPGTPARQEVRVYQNASGDLLLRADCSPVIKSMENFDLSPDGSLAVVVRGGALVVYRLPQLSKRDRDDIAEVQQFAPPPLSEGAVKLGRLTTPVKASAVASHAALPAPEQPTSTALTAVAPVKRNPPTLLNPGEKPEFGAPNEQPRTPPPQ